MKKILSVILILIFTLTLASCSVSDAPEGMQDATVAGEPFRLFVPKTFTINTASGISGAYMAFDAEYANAVIVTARHYTPAEAITLDEYLNMLQESFTESEVDAELVAISSAVLGGNDARKMDYTLTRGDKKYSVSQYVTLHKGDVISLSFYIASENAELFADGVEQILTYFTLTEKTAATGDNKVDKNTPDGMKIASSDSLEYRFYVPFVWLCDSESGVSEAYYPESDKTNVTVTAYSPDERLTLEEYYELCHKNYENTLANYNVTKVTKDLTVAGNSAIRLEFTAKYGEREYTVCQVMIYYPQVERFYNITYTATAESATLHMADFEAMVDAFTFR